MNLDGIAATLEANKVPVLAAAGAGVVGLALYRKKKGTAGAGKDGAASSTTTPAGIVVPASAGGQTGGMGGAAAYDSSASDLYGAVQPQLEALGSQLADLANQIHSQPAPTPVPTPVVAPVPTPAPAAAHPQTPVATRPSYAVDTWYTVKPGDSLSKIAARFPQQGITASSIGQANNIANLNLIHPGQSLHIFGN